MQTGEEAMDWCQSGVLDVGQFKWLPPAEVDDFLLREHVKEGHHTAVEMGTKITTDAEKRA